MPVPKHAFWVWLFILALFLAVYGGENSKGAPPEVIDNLGPNYQLLHQGEERGKGNLTASPADVLHNYDVLKYTLDLKLFPGQLINKLRGQATIQAVSQTSSLSTVSLDLIGLIVDSCRVNSALTSFVRSNGKLIISLNRNYAVGEAITLDVFDRGIPALGLYFTNNKYGASVIYTRTQPELSRYWFPCYDLPSDKALCEIICTVPAGLKTISNGSLLSTTNNADNTVTCRWRENHPIATYLISLAVSDYAEIKTQVALGNDTLPVYYWVYEPERDKALIDFASTPQMISHFSELFGTYPFLDEKFSIAQAALTGAMEHQTCVSWGLGIEGSGANEWVVAHELAHHWWGNLVTCADFSNIWLNEGFATYSEALWKGEYYGEDRLKGHMFGLEWYVLNDSLGSVSYPIYNPPQQYLFGAAVYRKGAWVMHMLRHLLGDQVFFGGLRAYASTYAYGTANTEQFKNAMEQMSGRDLDWFFNQWVHTSGFPKYKWSWVYTKHEGKYYFDINTTQEQSAPLFYNAPVEFRVEFADGSDSTLQLFNSSRYQRWTGTLSKEPSSLSFDPDNYLLGVQNKDSYPALAGDLNNNGTVSIGDVVYLVSMLFYAGAWPSPTALADVDGNCSVALSDAIYLMNYTAGRGAAPKIGCSP